MPDSNCHLRIATYDDGSQVLVTDWYDDNGNLTHATVATRPNSWATWSRPMELTDAP